MQDGQDVPPAEVIERFTPPIDRLKQQEPPLQRLARASYLSPEAIESEERAHVDLGTLARLGYVKEGELLGDQLGWPEDWLPEPQRRLFFLIDARESERSCALFLLQDGERLEHQFFWLTRVEGLFGRQEHQSSERARQYFSKAAVAAFLRANS